ncbi:MAG TPA: molybdopterin cofactor-binding domain-containing protein [Gaiellaceae bacterium]|nr:molybdopterin cofactor-binding domain-containing protein [Gaiellaceae bacterium]
MTMAATDATTDLGVHDARAAWRRPDAETKATGAALYTQDVARPGMLHGVVVRAQHPAARIASVDPAAARAIPGVTAVLTAGDLPERRYGVMTPDEPILARDRVCYVGEPVALIAAETKSAALAASRALQVVYDELPFVITLADAIEPGSPRVVGDSENVVSPQRLSRGDVDGAFADAYRVVTTEIVSHRVHQTYLEPRCSLAEVIDDRLIVTTSSQAPFEVRQGLAQLFDFPLARVSVIVPSLGGGFGGKLHLGLAPYAAALALATRRPVQVVCSREEEFQSPAPRENSIVRLESAIDRDGSILGRRATIYLDSGAYVYDTTALVSVAALQAAGPYSIDAIEVVAAAVRTNTVPTGSFRAPTGPQMAYAYETHMNDIAEVIGASPLDVRRRNVMRDGAVGPTGQSLANVAMSSCLERVAAVLDEWRAAPHEPRHVAGRSTALRRGYGLACAWWNTFPAGGGATITLGESGDAFVYTGATEIGTGAVSTALAQVVGQGLGLSADRVHVVAGSTDTGPIDFGSQGSRTLYGAGGAVAAAVADVQRLIADAFEATASDLVFRDGTVMVAGAPSTQRQLSDVVHLISATGGPVIGVGRFAPIPPAIDETCASGLVVNSFNEPTFHCHGVELDVDEESGRIDVLRYVAAHDTGPVVNRAGVDGQIRGGVIQGIGYALYEEVQTDERGRTVNAGLVDYRIPTIADVPPHVEILVEEGFPGTGPFGGAKGVGEAPAILPAAAIGSAVRDAVGSQPTSLPLSPTTVLGIAAKRSDASVPVTFAPPPLPGVFVYSRPRVLADALDELALDGARVLAGGTDLVTLRAAGVLDASLLVDIKHLPELATITESESGLRIGAAVTMRALAKLEAPSIDALRDGARVVGAAQTRNRATLGGNVCRASPAGDTLPALLVLDATLHADSATGSRSIPISECFVGPGRTSLAPDELLAAIELPRTGGGSAYERATYRAWMDLAVVGVAARLVIEDGVCVDAAIALGGVAATPLLAPRAAQALIGATVDDRSINTAATLAREAASPIDDVRGTRTYRLRMTEVLAARVIRIAHERATNSRG